MEWTFVKRVLLDIHVQVTHKDTSFPQLRFTPFVMRPPWPDHSDLCNLSKVFCTGRHAHFLVEFLLESRLARLTRFLPLELDMTETNLPFTHTYYTQVQLQPIYKDNLQHVFATNPLNVLCFDKKKQCFPSYFSFVAANGIHQTVIIILSNHHWNLKFIPFLSQRFLYP